MPEPAPDVAINDARIRWESGNHPAAAAEFDRLLGVQRELIAAPGGLAEHGPDFVRWVDWPIQALLSQDDHYAADNRNHTEEALEYARRLDDPATVARALVHAGLANWNAGEKSRAAQHFGEALSTERELIAAPGGLAEHGPDFVRWVDWPIQALLSQDDNYAADNRNHTEEALEYARLIADKTSLAAALVNAGAARWKTGDRVAATQLFDEALGIQRELIAAPGGLAEHGPDFVRWVDWPIQALLSQDDNYAADNRDHTEEALAYARRLDDPATVARALVHAGLANWNAGEKSRAAQHFGEALSTERELIAAPGGLAEHGPDFVRWVDWPIQALLSQDDHYAADNRDHTEEALGYAKTLDDKPTVAAASINAGAARWKTGDHVVAAQLFDEALVIQRALVTASGGLAEHGPTFVRWVDWPVQALLSQDDRFAGDNRDYTEEALAYARRLEDPADVALALVNAGLANWNATRRSQAVKYFEEALRTQRALISAPEGSRVHGPAFLRWVEWPIAAVLSQDSRYWKLRAALLDEAATLARAVGP